MSLNVVLYQPEIPQNTGNIMRTCAATNTKLHLIKPLGFSLEEKYLKRFGANYLEHVEFIIYEDWEDFLSKQSNKAKYYFLTRYSNTKPTEFNFSDIEEEIYLVFGSESSGIKKEILQDNINTCMRLPMSENVRSLNLSNCVAILVYEVLRQQNYNNLFDYELFKGEDFLRN